MTVEYHTTYEVAAIAKVSRATIYRIVERNEIKSTKFKAATRSQFIP